MIRRFAGVELLILDSSRALQPLGPTETADFYEICVERRQRADGESFAIGSHRTWWSFG